MTSDLPTGPTLGQLLREKLHSLLVIAVVFAIIAATFTGMHELLTRHGVTTSLLQSAGVWVGVGLVCALFWPLRYWENMRGYWQAGTFLQVGLLSLSGPCALLLGFPL